MDKKNDKTKIWENDYDFWGVLYASIAAFAISFMLTFFESDDHYHWDKPGHLIGIVLLIASLAGIVLTIYCIPRQEKWKDKKKVEKEMQERLERLKIKEEEERRKLEATRCPKCGQLNAIRIERKLVDERLVGVREARYYRSVWEVEDYEQQYLVSEECCFCDYSKLYSTIERHTERVRLLY